MSIISFRYLVENKNILQNSKVLEIGSGCGLCGIIASKLGALSVTLTDNTSAVLENLQKCMEMNQEVQKNVDDDSQSNEMTQLKNPLG